MFAHLWLCRFLMCVFGSFHTSLSGGSLLIFSSWCGRLADGCPVVGHMLEQRGSFRHFSFKTARCFSKHLLSFFYFFFSVFGHFFILLVMLRYRATGKTENTKVIRLTQHVDIAVTGPVPSPSDSSKHTNLLLTQYIHCLLLKYNQL